MTSTTESTKGSELKPGDVVVSLPDWLNERTQRRTVESVMVQAPSEHDPEIAYLVTFTSGAIFVVEDDEVVQVEVAR